MDAIEREGERYEEAKPMSFDDFLGPPVDLRYRRAVERQNRKAPIPPFACTPADLEAVGDDGHLGLLVVLVGSGWILYERRGPHGTSLSASNQTGDYVYGVAGETQEARALALFKALYSDEPDAIACAQAFWPPPERVTLLVEGRR